MKLTSHERLMRIFRNQEIDRPSLKLWGSGLDTEHLLHGAYKPVAELAAETTDLFCGATFPMNFHAGRYIDRYSETYMTDTASPDWKHHHTVFHTPKGDLHTATQISTKGEPCYTIEHMIKEPEDIDYTKILGLKQESAEKLSKIRPMNIGQASRISGVNPADISVLLMYLNR